jgi:drug/metabolite transporter (DMT)-like permease
MTATDSKQRNQRKAYIFAMTAVLLWSTVAAAFKLSLRSLSFVELLVFSSIVATGCLGITVLVTGRGRQVLASTKKQWLRSIVLGFLNPVMYYLILLKAYDLLPAQQAQPINYTWALTLSVLAVPLLGQKLGLGDIVGLVLGYCGVLIISTEGHVLALRFTSPLGVALALGSTVVWALFWIYSTKDDRDPVVCIFQSFLCSLVPVLALYLLFCEIRIPPLFGLLGATYVGAIEMSLAFVAWLMAMRLSENTAKVGSLVFLSPVLSLVFIHFLVGETIAWSTIVGLLLIVVALILQKKLGAKN